MRASSGVRPPLRRLHDTQHVTMFSQSFRPPCETGTLIVDFLAHPDDISGLKTLLRWVDRAARAEHSDKVRCYTLNDSFRRVLRRQGYFGVKSSVEMAVKVNAVQVPRGFYEETENWHITYGDSEP